MEERKFSLVLCNIVALKRAAAGKEEKEWVSNSTSAAAREALLLQTVPFCRPRQPPNSDVRETIGNRKETAFTLLCPKVRVSLEGANPSTTLENVPKI